MDTTEASFIAVDWGTTRLRASLVGRDGAVLDRTEADQGVQSVVAGGFPAALETACGSWLHTRPDLPVLMAGMVGSRNGWVEAPYVSCPCGPADLAGRMVSVDGPRSVAIVPGVDMRWPDGAYDVMRGEEVQVVGSGVRDGLVCLPGTHSKWVVVEAGRMTRFATFITGELYSAMAASFVGRLATTAGPDDVSAGLDAGLRVASAGGGLSRLLFQVRSQVLGGTLAGDAVRPFLSALLVAEEVAGAARLFGPLDAVHLIAAAPQLDTYQAALAQRGTRVSVVDPAAASLAGLSALMALRT